ncbi:hypothetical protein [Sphingomonas sp. IW22]|uniref:hypothetical protein n=1 Tax=Sphingomonas sp. IW22 TaxID=3242489 RepID=UPI003521B4BD
MSTAWPVGEEPEVFTHQVRALRARQRREDDEAIGGLLKRAGFRAQIVDGESRGPQRSSNAGGSGSSTFMPPAR